MNKLSQLLKRVDDNILTILLCGFSFLIPLYPKIPLIVVNYTYVSIRLEDYFIALLTTIFAIQFLRKKVTIPMRFIAPFALFWAVAFASYYVGYYINHTIPSEFQKVGFYHALRRVEYMMMFFIAAAAIRRSRDFILLITSAIASMFLISIYGLLQRFYDYPAIQTMNPEYAKGRILTLTEEARISSTFGGHYDLAAFLVFMIPIVWGVYMLTRGFLAGRIKFTEPLTGIFEFFKKIFIKYSKKLDISEIQKIEGFPVDAGMLVTIGLIGSLTTLLLAAAIKTYEIKILITLIPSLIIFLLLFRFFRSTVLFILIILSLFIMTFTASRMSIIAYLVTTPALIWLMRRYVLAIIVIFMSILIMMTNQSLIERFFATFQIKQFLINEQTGETHVLQRIQSDKLPAGSQIVLKVAKKKSTADEEIIKKSIIQKAITPTVAPRGPYFRITPIPLASAAAQFRSVFGVAPDISFSTRLQVEWPRAIGAFMLNPFIGTGPSSITDATDNDYLRWLGETGFLGFGIFIFILLHIAHYIVRRADALPESLRPLFYAPVFGLFGLMINATYIDVFEASKVAFIFWYVMGLFVGILRHEEK